MLRTTLPLIAGSSSEAAIAWRAGGRVTAGQFVQQAMQLAAQLPAGAQLLNLCEDRYHFAVCLAAGLIAGRSTLLPPTQAPQVLRRLHALGAPLVALGERADAPAPLAQLGSAWINVDALQPAPCSASACGSIPQIDAQAPAVVIFTSGSTGEPVPHVKSFGQLVAAAQVEMTRLPAHAAAGAGAGAGYALLGTVPAQHMFGLESTVVLPLQSGGLLCAERPFFPADIAAALLGLRRPRALVSTPLHLRALLDGGVALPPLDLVLCATAPLSESLARELEARFHTQLLEIFGSTETGQIASRRTARERAWHLWPGVRLRFAEDRWWAHGGHVRTPTPLADVFEPLDETHFILHGRTADLVNVAGKRSSLAHLSQQLLGIPGVLDGAFFIHEPARGSITGVSRLAAVVVAPSLTRAKLFEALRERMDAVFLPRPLWLVQHLPRNVTGKLPQEALRALAAQLPADPAGSEA